MNKFIVRFTILFCAVYFLYVMYHAWYGISVFNDSYKLLLEYCLYVQAASNKKYNCRYMRFLALSLFASDSISVIDMQYSFIPQGYTSLIILSSIWTAGILATVFLAINHFRKVRRLKNIKQRYEEFKLKK